MLPTYCPAPVTEVKDRGSTLVPIKMAMIEGCQKKREILALVFFGLNYGLKLKVTCCHRVELLAKSGFLHHVCQTISDQSCQTRQKKGRDDRFPNHVAFLPDVVECQQISKSMLTRILMPSLAELQVVGWWTIASYSNSVLLSCNPHGD